MELEQKKQQLQLRIAQAQAELASLEAEEQNSLSFWQRLPSRLDFCNLRFNKCQNTSEDVIYSNDEHYLTLHWEQTSIGDSKYLNSVQLFIAQDFLAEIFFDTNSSIEYMCNNFAKLLQNELIERLERELELAKTLNLLQADSDLLLRKNYKS